MNIHWKKRTAAFLGALAAVLTFGVLGASSACVSVEGAVVDQGQAWVRDGTSYITLWAFSQLSPYELSWDGDTAWLRGEGRVLEVRPGELFVRADGRLVFAEEEIQVVNDRTVLPLRVLAKAIGGELVWNKSAVMAELSMASNTAAAPADSTETPPLSGTQTPTPGSAETTTPGSAETTTPESTETTTPDSADSLAQWSEEDLYWLSRIISAESRGEPLRGQIAVGNVVLNRVKSSQYPDTIKGVVFDRKYGVQFEPVENGTIYDEPTESALQAARMCLEGADVVGECLYFYAPALSAGTWIVNNCTYYTTIGCHRFYL